jgi:hypothetical protein
MVGVPFYVCSPCSLARNPGGYNTAQAAIDAGTAHGCVRRARPRKGSAPRVRIPAPRNLPAEEWRSIVASMVPGPEPPPRCRSRAGSCGHSEAVHGFSSTTQDCCRLNCRLCALFGVGA